MLLMGFGWPSAHLFLICPEEEGLLQFHFSTVLGSWMLFSPCGYLPHSDSGVLEVWVILVVVTCSTLRLNNVFRKLILVTFTFLFLPNIWVLVLVYCPWLTYQSVRIPHNSLYGIHLTVIFLRLWLPSTAFHRYWSISGVLSAACGI